MGALPLMHAGSPLRLCGREVPDPSRGWLAVPADHGIGVLEDVYPDSYAELLGGEPPLPRLAISVREVHIHYVCLTDPDALFKGDPVLIAVPRW